MLTRVYHRARHVQQTHTFVRREFAPALRTNVVRPIYANLRARHRVPTLK